MDHALFARLEASIADPAHVAIETASERVTYADLVARTGRMANALRTLGVRPGDRVAAQVEKSARALVLYLATLRAGAAFLPLNTAYTANELGYFVGDAEPALIVCDPARREATAAFGPRVETLDASGEGTLADAARAAPAAFETVARAGDDLAAILYTSGTTGRSKGAMLTHDNLVSNALTLVEAWRFTAADRLIHALPTYHTHGLFVATNTCLFAGATIDLLPRFDPDAVLERMPRSSVLMGVPTMYVRLLADPRLPEAARGMRLFVSGSAPLLAETHRTWAAVTGQAILERYGMTETNMNTSNPYAGERVAGSVGPALPGVDVRVADPATGAGVPTGEIGMIEVRGPNVFKGYWRQPEKTAAEFRPDGFFVTGDLGTMDARGYVTIVGRGKDLVICGGLNVYPKEVEGEIDALEGVVESAVVGLPHPDLGEAVMAVVVRVPGADLDEATIVGALEERIARFKRPKRVVFVEALPRNAMGKVQKAALRDTYAGMFTGKAPA